MDIHENLNASLVLYAIALALIGISSVAGSYNSDTLSAIVMAVWTIVLILYAIAYSRNSRAKSYLHIASISCFILFLFTYINSWTAALDVVSVAVYPIPLIITLLSILFLAQLYLSNKTRLRWLFLGAAVIIAILYFSVITTQYIVPDESVISYYAYSAFLHGANPYSINVSANLTRLHNTMGIGLSYNKNSTLVSNFRYPALYFLIQAPFYLLMLPNLQNIGGSFSSAETIAGFLIFIIAYLSIYRKRPALANPSYAAIILFAVLGFGQFILLFMLSLIMFMYSDFGQRHKWLILGIMVSLQEQLWAVALLFIVYEFMNNHKNGARTLLGAVGIFILVNGYFILLSPHAFINSFASEVSGLQANDTSPLSHLLFTFGVSSQVVTAAFFVSILASVLLLLWLKDYKTIPLLSIIPFLFLSHSGTSYFAIPFIAFAFIDNLSRQSKSSHSTIFILTGTSTTNLIKCSVYQNQEEQEEA